MNHLTATLNQIGQVCRLYWVVCTSSFGAFCISVWVVIFGVVGMLAMGPKSALNCASIIYSVAALTYLLKHQVVHLRERRLPHAIAPHILVWAVLLFIFTLGIPMVRVLSGVQISLAMFGIITTIAALTIWGTVINNLWLIVFVFPFIFLPFGLTASPDTKRLLSDFIEGKYDGLGLAMFAMGIAGIIFGVLRLLRISEEDRDYFTKAFQKPADYSGQPAAGLIDRESQKAIWKSKWMWFYDLRSKSIPFWRIWARGNVNQRAKLWTIARGGNATMLMFPVIVSVPLALWLLSNNSDISRIINRVPMYTAFPLLISMSQWEQQRSIWPMELLRPADRKQFFMEMGFTMFKQAAIIWFVLAAAFTAEILAISPDAETFQKVVKLQFLLAGSQFLIFGIVVELLRYRTRAIKLLTAVIVFPVYFLVFMRIGTSSQAEWFTVAWAVFAMIVVGVALTYDAYRRWLQTELG